MASTKKSPLAERYPDDRVAGIDKISTDHMVTYEFTDSGKSQLLSPEKKLLQRLLEDAVDTLKKARIESHLRRETVRWFLSETTDWVFDFVNVCSTLNLNPTAFRRQLNRMLNNLGKDELGITDTTEDQTRRRVGRPGKESRYNPADDSESTRRKAG